MWLPAPSLLRLATLVLLVLVNDAHLAHAQAAPEVGEQSPAAHALFVAGREAMKLGDYATACARFRESNRLERATGTQLNLAICETKRGHLATAWELYQTVLRALPADDPRQDLVRAEARAVERRVPRVILRVAQPIARDLVVVHQGTKLTHSAFGVPIPVDPGDHVFLVHAKGRSIREYRISLGEGERREILVQPGAPLPAPPPAPTPTDTRFTWGIISFGVAGSAFVIGAASGLMVLRKKAIISDPAHCDPSSACDAEGIAAADSGHEFAIVSNVAFAAGLVAAGVGTYLILSRGPRADTDARTERSQALGISAHAFQHGGGVTLTQTY